MLLRPDPRLRIAADFPAADGIFAGSRVALLGVPVGHVEEVRPQGSTVRVTMSLPGESRVPRDAHAYIMSPAVVSDRFVELSPPTPAVLRSRMAPSSRSSARTPR
ncbi:MlaD family protein [Prauserella oleivorans]